MTWGGRGGGASWPCAAGPRTIWVCHRAMRMAIEKARRFGVGLVSARAGIRILTPIVRAAADAGMIGVSFTQSTPAVAPLGGKEARLGNAPTAVAIPAPRPDPIILDLSLTNTSTSGLLLSACQHQQVPAGFILDPEGEPTIEPCDVFADDLDANPGPPQVHRECAAARRWAQGLRPGLRDRTAGVRSFGDQPGLGPGRRRGGRGVGVGAPGHQHGGA